MRSFRYAYNNSQLPRNGYIMSNDKLYKIKKGVVIKTYDLPGLNVDENISYLMDSSGILGSIPAWKVPENAEICIDIYGGFKSYKKFVLALIGIAVVTVVVKCAKKR